MAATFKYQIVGDPSPSLFYGYLSQVFPLMENYATFLLSSKEVHITFQPVFDPNPQGVHQLFVKIGNEASKDTTWSPLQDPRVLKDVLDSWLNAYMVLHALPIDLKEMAERIKSPGIKPKQIVIDLLNPSIPQREANREFSTEQLFQEINVLCQLGNITPATFRDRLMKA